MNELKTVAKFADPMLASIAQVLPLPLVPATWMNFSPFSGFPISFKSCSIRFNPRSMVKNPVELSHSRSYGSIFRTHFDQSGREHLERPPTI